MKRREQRFWESQYKSRGKGDWVKVPDQGVCERKKVLSFSKRERVPKKATGLKAVSPEGGEGGRGKIQTRNWEGGEGKDPAFIPPDENR